MGTVFDEEVFQFVIDQGADLNDKDNNGSNFLHYAARRCNLTAVEFALHHGLKASERNSGRESWTALQLFSSSVMGGSTDEYPYIQIRKLLCDAYRSELPRCRFCRHEAAHIQMKPCDHQTSCFACSENWEGCQCGQPIENKVDVLNCNPVEAVEPAEVATTVMESTCAVCLDRAVAVVFSCGHRACEECSVHLQHCHSCRGPIGTIIKFY